MGDLENEVEVPRYFLCPISLEIMKDPVTLSTGITYDHDSIEKWLFSQKNDVCPVTKQVVVDIELTPNHTLRRLIQSWCTLNASSGVERFPTPRPSTSRTEIVKLLKSSKSPQMQMNSLKRLKTIVMENEKNKRVMKSVGAADHLVSILNNVTSSSPVGEVSGVDGLTAADEALTILYHLQLSQTGLKSLFGNTEDFVETLTTMMQRATCYESRAYAVMLLKSMFEVAEPTQMTALNPRFFTELVQILVDQISEKATKATLKLLINVCPWGRNRIRGAEAGAVPVLIDILLDCPEKRVSEMVIMVLEQICRSAEGRADLLKHGGGLAVVSKKIFRVSSEASERAVRILYSVAMFSGNSHVVQEMMQLGVVGKLLLVLQVDCGSKMKERAREILKMHSRVWKKSSCMLHDSVDSYPS
ncbi:E3 ubiquitin-protein ligase PUB23-like [Cynara cardunculus var. scolymus]|uniref:E3 ubiquitin-protein ligase PUB23-like n=1 Tax=Cynara cardunculus var. scolymus TaxID=59895 RepID=UPI000D6238FB|nr:E3 ubiquitin-protein ligase PUB23-like [Cynara cardunculus var. scolymus]